MLELEKAICEVGVKKPSESATPEIARQLRGDLDTIVCTAMRREPQRRYASAEHFSEDVRRYLEGQPVSAHRDTIVYRARKFVGRHRPAVAASARQSCCWGFWRSRTISIGGGPSGGLQSARARQLGDSRSRQSDRRGTTQARKRLSARRLLIWMASASRLAATPLSNGKW